jgi:hypothetical protein
MKFLKNSTYKKLVDQNEELAAKIIKMEEKKVVVTPTASSRRDVPTDSLPFIQKSLKVVQAGYQFDVIPIIRKLADVNPDVNQALNDFVKLANTGHEVVFNQEVKPEQANDMRRHLLDSAKSWHVGAAGINGIVNKMFRQAMIGGALSMEWVPNLSLDNVKEIRFVYPERIRFVLEKNSTTYHPYQQLKYKPINNINLKDLKRLNSNQYRYFALNGDTDVPYGTPPYLSSLEAISVQKKMLDNISFVVEAMGILGYIDARIDKPEQEADESDAVYKARLQSLLTDFKEVVAKGLRDGINVGYMDDHEYNFNTTTTTAQGAKDLFEQNELMVASGLGYDAAFMGRPGSTETLITVLFTKMLAQLKNIQDIVGAGLEFGYRLSLALAGYDFKSLKVQFKKSTLTDEVKHQQAMEYKVRNLMALYAHGIIGQDQFANEMGYDEPDEKEPRVEIDPSKMGQQSPEDVRKDQKNDSARRTRDKANPQGTVKRQNGKMSLMEVLELIQNNTNS